MAFFKSFQESLSSVSVSSILDSVSSTVSNTVDGVRTAVSDVTYTVSDQLTEQVSTIINKKQGEDEDKGKRDDGEDSDNRTGAGERINSKRHAFADEEEERREREKQEQERRNEEEQWEWCYAPSKGWYRKRKDPNQRDTTTERQENNEERTGVSGQLLSSNRDVNLQNVTRTKIENSKGGQEDSPETSTETAYSKDTRPEQCLNSKNDHNGHDYDTLEEQTQEIHGSEGLTPERHIPEGQAQEAHTQSGDESVERRNSTYTEPKQNTGAGADEGEAVGNSSVPQEEDDQEGSSRSKSSSVLNEQHDDDEVVGSQGHLEVANVSEDKKNAEGSFKKERFRRCTLL